MREAIQLFTALGVAFMLYLQLKMYRMLERSETAVEQAPATSLGSWLEVVGLTSELLAIGTVTAFLLTVSALAGLWNVYQNWRSWRALLGSVPRAGEPGL